jgi:hypothetical protein
MDALIPSKGLKVTITYSVALIIDEDTNDGYCVFVLSKIFSIFYYIEKTRNDYIEIIRWLFSEEHKVTI